MAHYNKKPIAGSVYFHLGNKVEFKYGASDQKYQYLRPNNLVMWKAIQWYCQNGYKSLCLGRTEKHHKGLMQYKDGWGTKKEVVKYYKYDFKRNDFVNGENHLSGYYNMLFRKMPIPLLKIVGSLFYKHIG